MGNVCKAILKGRDRALRACGANLLCISHPCVLSPVPFSALVINLVANREA